LSGDITVVLLHVLCISAKSMGICDIGGVHSILLIDISRSMQTAWGQVRTFVHDYLNGKLWSSM